MQKKVARPNARAHLTQLSNREKQVVDLLAAGRIYKEIATDLSLSIDTVRMHIKSIYRKFRVTTKKQAVKKHLANTSAKTTS